MELLHKLPLEKRDAVLHAGIEEFSQHSYTDASTDAITQSAGISKGLLFHYFGSKKAFYLFCLQTALERLTANTPAPDLNDFFGILFFVMDEKIRLCRDFPKETLLVNLAARDAAAAINEEKQALFAQYLANTTMASQQVLARAMATLPLKDPADSRLLDALSLYINSINQKFLLQYRETPEHFFANAPQIQQEMKDYLSYMLNGVLVEGESL